MKILAPVASLTEASILISEGAKELYCGLQPNQWSKEFGEGLWLNRRGPGQGNLRHVRELSELVDLAHLNGVSVYLTLNQSVYSDAVYREIIRLVQEIYATANIDALIIGDPGLMKTIKEKVPEAKLHASSLGAIFNNQTARFFRDMGASRIIFPRYVALEDMAHIIEEIGPDMEYEAFILNDGCIFDEAYCFVNHAFGGAICHNPHWVYKLHNVHETSGIDYNHLFPEHLIDYREFMYVGIKNMGECTSPHGDPLGMCGLCALPALKRMGICSLKIVGREARLEKKKGCVRLLRKSLDFLDNEEHPEIIKMDIKRLRSIPKICNSKFMCYYRDQD